MWMALTFCIAGQQSRNYPWPAVPDLPWCRNADVRMTQLSFGKNADTGLTFFSIPALAEVFRFSSELALKNNLWGIRIELDPAYSKPAYYQLSYHVPYVSHDVPYLARKNPTDLHCTLLSYPAPFWATCTLWAKRHPAELRCTLLSYAATSKLSCILLSYVAPGWAMPHPH